MSHGKHEQRVTKVGQVCVCSVQERETRKQILSENRERRRECGSDRAVLKSERELRRARGGEETKELSRRECMHN
eukprot:6188387-Pleurochrysis_carterae.AAC.2